MGNKFAKSAITPDHINAEAPYGTQMNGASLSAPEWPQSNNNMFLLPKQYNTGDFINIFGTLAPNSTEITVSLLTDNNGSPDYQNIPCQLEIYTQFHPTSPDQTLINVIENGSPNNISTRDIITTNFIKLANFKVGFHLKSEEALNILLNDARADQVPAHENISNIRYIMVKGDFDKLHELSFQFGDPE